MTEESLYDVSSYYRICSTMEILFWTYKVRSICLKKQA